MDILKFEPLLKQTLWGGNKIKEFKHLSNDMDCVGESWEVSGVKGSETVVAEGPLKGQSLNELVRTMQGRLVGEENYRRFGNVFPLLVKYIDAKKDLSIQVHPNDEVAHRHGYPHGKTEMWYAVGNVSERCGTPVLGNASEHCIPSLYCGLKQELTPDTYKQMVDSHTITDALAHYEIQSGDVFFIPAGRIHSIGAGCFVAEIQQTSDVTYRIYDFNRRDKDGNLRQLHISEAAESIDYTVLDDYRTHYKAEKNIPIQLISCPHFTTALYDLDEPMTIDYSELDSFVIIMTLEGEATLTATAAREDRSEGQPAAAATSVTIRAGETVLIPACVDEVKVDGAVKFLETYV